MFTKAKVAVLWSVVLCTPSSGQQMQQTLQLGPDETAAISKAVKLCVSAVHAAATNEIVLLQDFYKKFDAYYNSKTGKVENNVTMVGEQKAFFVFKKCMSEKGWPLG
jgi:hypothetical protein